MANDGGPAFPTSELDGDGNSIGEPGMTLRDYFAGQALAGWMVGGSPTQGYEKHSAIRCYAMADAMLAARAQPATVSAADNFEARR